MTEPGVDLHRRDSLPEGFLHVTAGELHRLLPGPSLIHLAGRTGRPLFVVILQHGNEDSGLRAVQRLLAEYHGHTLPRPLSLFVANVAAARAGVRRLDGQPDYNRCWPGTELPASPETALMAAVLDELRPRQPVAALDLHNTTGHNPLHAAVNVLDPDCLQLARGFAGTVVHFTRPRGALPAAFAGLCPAAILECGRIGQADGIDRAHALLRSCLHRDPCRAPATAEPLELFASVAVVQVPAGIRFGFGDPPEVELALEPELDQWNFRELPAGTALGRVRGEFWPLRALAPDGREITPELFELQGGVLRLRHALMPSLLTRDPHVIRQDCLCHLLQRIDPPPA
ncbi:MAG: M14 family metallopeptidase [Halofilum sp. (in: g-proteobacteria)]|nr:M14 family metallopeptidase [Halofilum sp. (in: g-proteobacteria)]